MNHTARTTGISQSDSGWNSNVTAIPLPAFRHAGRVLNQARPGAESILSPDETVGGKDGVGNL
jgi:hypothetical protein